MSNDNRAHRYLGRAVLRTISNNARCRECGVRSILAGGTVGVRLSPDGHAGFAGLFTCGSVWLCPVCNSKIMARRSIEIGLVLLWAQANGLHVIWGALTCRHTASDPLAYLLALQSDSWRHVVSTRSWRAESVTRRVPHVEHVNGCPWVCAFDHETHDSGCEWHCTRKFDFIDAGGSGRVGYIRATELNVGANGWHPHFHPIVLYRGTRADADAHAADIVTDWVEGVERQGGEALKVGANGMRVLDDVAVWEKLSSYTTKQVFKLVPPDARKLSLEMVWSQSKNGTRRRFKETQSHWGLLAAVVESRATADVVEQWWEVEEATKGKRIVAWSRGLRSFAGLTDEAAPDEDVAAEEVGSKDDTVAVVTARGWRSLKGRVDVQALMLDALEGQGWEGLKSVLDFHGVEYMTPDEAADLGQPEHDVFRDDTRDAEYMAHGTAAASEPAPFIRTAEEARALLKDNSRRIRATLLT